MKKTKTSPVPINFRAVRALDKTYRNCLRFGNEPQSSSGLTSKTSNDKMLPSTVATMLRFTHVQLIPVAVHSSVLKSIR